MATITIELDEASEAQLNELSSEHRQAPEKIAAEIVRKRLRHERLQVLLRESQELAQAAGYGDEEKVLRDFS